MVDGLPSELGEVGSESILDRGVDSADLALESVSGGIIASGGVDIQHYVSSSISGAPVSAEFSPVRVGSPSTSIGNMIQAGSDTTSAGSTVDIVFGVAFLAEPFVVVTPRDAVTTTCRVLDSNAGSFTCESTAASESFNWVAIGSGR